MVVTTIFTEVLGDKLSDSSIPDIYTSYRMNLASDTVNIPEPQFVDLGLSTINSLDKDTSLWNPTPRFESPIDVIHGSVTDHIFENYGG